MKMAAAKRVNLLQEIRRDVDALLAAPELREPGSHAERGEALDRLEVDIHPRIEALQRTAEVPRQAIEDLRRVAEDFQAELERLDEILFRSLRARIRVGGGRGGEFRKWLTAHAGLAQHLHRCDNGPGYDTLDTFLNGLLFTREIPAETRSREPEMVFYQKTPARILLRLAETARLTEADTFFDLGSGLGQAALVVHLLTGAASRGIEWEPAFRDFSRDCADDLGLPRVEFRQGDARDADYSDGTVFFLYTPFEGNMLRDVLAKLRSDTRGRGIEVYTYGPCTDDVARETWLQPIGPVVSGPHALAGFQSL